MADTIYTARLVNGPYHDDCGRIDFLPPRLWVFRCTECGDTHWTTIYDNLPDGAAAAPYDLETPGPDDRGFWLYVYGDTTTPVPSSRTHELAPA